MPIHKKGDNKCCENYRGITILSTLVKLYEQIIERRLRGKIEHTLIDSQSGFRRGRSTQDHIFTLKEIMNKTLSRGEKKYLAFLDLEKAFDRVPRSKIWESLKNRKTPAKLLAVIKSLYKETLNCVILKNMQSEIFATHEGVRQGGTLSPLLFIAFMDDIIRRSKQKMKPMYVGHRRLQRVEITECAFADDIVIMARNVKDLEDNLKIWQHEAEQSGMKLNMNKTKVLAVTQNREEIKVEIEGEEVEQVSSYQYLGVILEGTGNQEVEIDRRVESSNRVYYAMNNGFISRREITKDTKLKVFKSIYRPILTYGCETWVLSQRMRSKLQACEMKYLRKVRGVTRRDKIRNEQIRTDLGMESVSKFIEQRQLSWWGHLQRMDDDVPVRKIWEAKAAKRKKRGRPRETWDDTIGKLLNTRGKTWREGKELAQDRQEWSRFVRN